MHHGREEKRGLMMAPWTRIAIPIFVIAAAALGYLYFGRETACEQDPRSRACFELMLETHLAR
jgi:hypothetical protein